MALIVEDGSVVTGAESYITVAEFKDYCDKRGRSYSGFANDTAIEQGARRAWDYLLQKYRGQWKGYRKNIAQKGDWPRAFVYLEPFYIGGIGDNPFLVDSNSIPDEIKTASIELMLRNQDASQDLNPDLEQQETSVTVDVISVQYDKSSDQSPRFEAVDDILAPYLAGARSATSKLMRS